MEIWLAPLTSFWCSDWKCSKTYEHKQRYKKYPSTDDCDQSIFFINRPDVLVGRVSAPGNGRSRARSRATTYQIR